MFLFELLDLNSGRSPSFYRLLLEDLMKLSTPAGGFVELSAAAPEYSAALFRRRARRADDFFACVGVSPRVFGCAIRTTGS